MRQSNLQLKLDTAGPIPVYLQIAAQVRDAVAAGSLGAGDEVPSVRALASQYLINPNTVARAYLELEHEGLLEKRRGAGTYVSSQAEALSRQHRVRAVSDMLAAAIAAARQFGLTGDQIGKLWDKQMNARKERSA